MAAPLLVVDTPSMLYRAFFALPKSIKGADGQPVNALLGTANLVLREVAEHGPRAVVLCFGAEAAHYRVELYSGYHADRPEMPELLERQWEVSGEFFSAFGWRIAQHETLEADDLLGSLAEAETAAGGTTLIMTGDRDMFQCVNESVTVLYPTKGVQGMEAIGPAGVRERYGIDPAQVPDFIALRGDPSDRIPGAPGFGPKKAADLLHQYGSLEEAIAAGRFSAIAEELRLYRRIASLDASAPLPPLKDQTPTWAEASSLLSSWGMNAVAERVAGRAK